MWRLPAATRDSDGQPPAKTSRQQGEAATAKDRKRPATDQAPASAGGGHSGVNRMMIPLQKVSLQSAQQVRGFAGAQSRTYLVPASLPPVVAAMAAGAQYIAAVTGVRRHGLGPPHIHTCMAFLESVSEQGTPSQDFMKSFLALLNAAPQVEVAHLMEYFRVRDIRPPREAEGSPKSPSPAAMLVEVAGAAGGVADARVALSLQFGPHLFGLADLSPYAATARLYATVHSYLVGAGAEQALGAAPPGQAGRSVQGDLQGLLRR